MAATNFPHGVASYGIPLIGSGPIVTTGNIWFCDSGSAQANDSSMAKAGKSPERLT